MSAATSRSWSNPNAIQALVGAGDRHPQLEIGAQAQRQPHLVERAFDRRARHLAVSLRRVAVAGREQRAVDADRQQQRRARGQLLAVDVAAEPAGRRGGVDAGLGRRHADHAQEGGQRDRLGAVRGDADRPVQLPLKRALAGEGDAPAARPHQVDPNLQRPARAGPANRDRPGQRMAVIEHRVQVVQPRGRPHPSASPH